MVLCNPVGDDDIRAHRTLRHLAERLAQAGFPALRFDFHGTGDSSGDERDPGRLSAWLGDVTQAIEELRGRSGVPQIAVVGLRLGATLAMAAAAGGGVDTLVLWSPFVDGVSFVTDNTRRHSLHRMLEPQSFAGGPRDNSEGKEALGFLLTHATLAELRQLDLLAVKERPAQDVLVFWPGRPAQGPANGSPRGQGKEPAANRLPDRLPGRLIDHLRSLGCQVECRDSDGPKVLTMTPHRSVLPTEELDAVVAFLSARHPAIGPAEPPSARTPREALTVGRPVARMPGEGEGDAGGSERVLRFGRQRPLLGFLHLPVTGVPAGRSGLPAIVLLNAGTVHRIGPHRMYVTLARRWARMGFTVLRVDLSGIGDSPAAPGGEENLCYPPDALSDIDEAIATLAAETGARQVVLMGLCSGADLAFKKAISDRRVAGIVMMNPRSFCVNDLDLIAAYQHARYSQGSLFRLESWLKLLRGQANLRHALQGVLRKLKDVARHRGAAGLHKLAERFWPGVTEGERPTPDVPACLRLLAERGVDTFLLVAEHDPGVDYVDANFARQMHALLTVPGFRREDIHGTDHTFTSRWSQEHVADLLSDHLAQRFLT